MYYVTTAYSSQVDRTSNTIKEEGPQIIDVQLVEY